MSQTRTFVLPVLRVGTIPMDGTASMLTGSTLADRVTAPKARGADHAHVWPPYRYGSLFAIRRASRGRPLFLINKDRKPGLAKSS